MSYRILIVGGDPGVRERARHFLEFNGDKLLGAADGFEGLSALKAGVEFLFTTSPDNIPSLLRVERRNWASFPAVLVHQTSA